MASGSGGQVAAFRAELVRHAEQWSVPCSRAQLDALIRYADLLLMWTARINLTGASSLADLAAEHLPDSFALAARLTTAGASNVVDVGSGGGLPALPLAVLCPELKVRLLEPIAKKAAFLRTAIRELTLGDRLSVEGARAEKLVPATFDVAMSRATLPPLEWMAVATQLVTPGGRIFVLASADADPGAPPAPLKLVDRSMYMDGRRILLELLRSS